MRKVSATVAVAVVGLLVWAASSFCAEVSQGKCIKLDESNMLLSLEEYDTDFSPEHPYGKPTGVISLYNLSNALMGVSPKPGDILRIAYEIKGTQRMALKVMNVSRQDLMKK